MSACGWWMVHLVFWSQIMFIIAQIYTNVWLSQWTSDPITNDTEANHRQTLYRLTVYGGLGALQSEPLLYLIVCSSKMCVCNHPHWCLLN